MKNHNRCSPVSWATSARYFSLLIALTLYVTAMPVWAISVSLVTDSQTVTVGQSVKVDLIASGLDPTQVIGMFYVEVTVDPSILSAANFSSLPTETVFSSYLGVPGHQTTAAWGTTDLSYTVADVLEQSYLGTFDLQSLQQESSFRLASFYLDAFSVGTNQLEFATVSLGGPCIVDQNACTGVWPTLSVTTGNTVSISVITQSAVPIPAALWLFGSGLVGIVMNTRKRKFR